MTRVLASLALIACAAPAFATGDHTCNAPDRAAWKPMDALSAKLVAEGWKVSKVKEDGDCYEVYAILPDGKKAEAYFHPVTFAQEKIETR